MQVIPAIDLKNGRCVRLLQGNSENETVYGDDPVAVAVAFQKAGIGKLHLIDLDAALGSGDNFEMLRSIVQALDIGVEAGGGIRDMIGIERRLKAGAAQVILGTAATGNTLFVREAVDAFGPERIIVSVDSLDGRIAVMGWREVSQISEEEFIESLYQNGVQRIVYTDVSRDGTLRGLDRDRLVRLAVGADIAVTVAGGVSCVADIGMLVALRNPRIDSVVVGKAFYEGKISLAEMARYGNAD